MNESQEVKIARIEEGMVALRGEFREVRKDIDGYHTTIGRRVLTHQDDITILKRDRFWLFTLSSFAFGSGLLAMIEAFKR